MKKDSKDNPIKGGESSIAVAESSQALSPAEPRRGTARLRADSSAVPARRNITLQLEESGAPKWETVTEKNREAWREILSHPSTVQALGLAPRAAAAPSAPLIPSAAVGALFDGLSRFEALACAKLLKVPFDDAQRLLAFTPEEKEKLVPVTQALAEKYIPVAAEKYGAEFTFAWLLLSMVAAKVQAVQALPREAGPPSSPPADSPAEARLQ
jgi:hypothetical protein